ncbi:MAG: hypothetical protein LBB88_08520 [Planctomycetaceae bacterium]|jgi:hypothetical protein|nr:hypothetical protein [Planctomycetaceae bacterium]
MQDNNSSDQDKNSPQNDNNNNNYYQVLPANPPKSGCGGYGCLTGCGVGCIVLIIILAITGFLIYAYCIKGVPLQISPETTVITTPLKSDGKSVDYLSVIKEKTEPANPPKNNGFKDVLAAYGKELFVKNTQEDIDHGWIFAELCKKIELDPNFTPSHIYEKPDFYADLLGKINEKDGVDEIKEVYKDKGEGTQLFDEYENAESNIFKNVLSKNWSIKKYPKLEEWLNKVNSGLDIVQKATTEEHYFIPMIQRNENELAILALSPPVIAAHQNLTHGLQVRSMLLIGEGNFSKAWDNMIASFRLQRRLENKGIKLFDNKAKQVASQITITLAESSSNWTPEQLNKAIADLESIPPSPKREELLLVAQYTLLDIFSMAGNPQQLVESVSGRSINSHQTGEQLEGLVNLLKIVGFNWNIVAKKLNESIATHQKTINDSDTEKILNTKDKETQLEMEKFINESVIKLQHKLHTMITVAGRSEIVGFVLGEIIPALEKHIFKQSLNDEVRYRFLQTIFTIELYKLENQKYPESTEQLKLNPPKISAIKTNYKLTDKGYKISIGELEFTKQQSN